MRCSCCRCRCRGAPWLHLFPDHPPASPPPSMNEGEIDRKVETATVLGSNHGSLNAPAFRVYGCGHHASWTPGWRKVSTQQTRTSQHELRRRPPCRLLKMRQSCQVELYPLQPTRMWRYLIWRVNYRRGRGLTIENEMSVEVESKGAVPALEIRFPRSHSRVLQRKKDLLVLGYLNTVHMFNVSWCCRRSLKYATTVYNWVFAIRSVL